MWLALLLGKGGQRKVGRKHMVSPHAMVEVAALSCVSIYRSADGGTYATIVGGGGRAREGGLGRMLVKERIKK
jgi:hypothetical protein